MDATTTPYDGTALAGLYNCKGQPAKYVWALSHFETKPCSRCGGGGHYSYCQRYGTVCFGCSGLGYQYTARGQAARDHYTSLLSKPVRALAPGDKLWDEYSGCWRTVVEAGRDMGDQGCRRLGYDYEANVLWYYRTPQLGATGLNPDEVVRVAASADEKKVALAKAVAYQATLTQAGKPRKRQPAAA